MESRDLLDGLSGEIRGGWYGGHPLNTIDNEVITVWFKWKGYIAEVDVYIESLTVTGLPDAPLFVASCRSTGAATVLSGFCGEWPTPRPGLLELVDVRPYERSY